MLTLCLHPPLWGIRLLIEQKQDEDRSPTPRHTILGLFLGPGGEIDPEEDKSVKRRQRDNVEIPARPQ